MVVLVLFGLAVYVIFERRPAPGGLGAPASSSPQAAATAGSSAPGYASDLAASLAAQSAGATPSPPAVPSSYVSGLAAALAAQTKGSPNPLDVGAPNTYGSDGSVAPAPTPSQLSTAPPRSPTGHGFGYNTPTKGVHRNPAVDRAIANQKKNAAPQRMPESTDTGGQSQLNPKADTASSTSSSSDPGPGGNGAYPTNSQRPPGGGPGDDIANSRRKYKQTE